MIPCFQVRTDDRDVTAKIRHGLISLRITDKQGLESDAFEIVMSDPDGRLALPQRGVTLRVAVGFDNRLTDKGTYTVDEVSHSGAPDTITITGRAAKVTSALTEQRDASYHDTTVGAIVTTIAERHGLIPALGERLSALPVPHLDQTAESDANLLTRLGQDYDAVATVKEDRLIFTDRDGSNAGGQRLGTARIARSDGDRHSFKIAKREAVGSVKAKWRDLGNGATNTVEVTADPEDERGPEGDAKATSKTLRGTYASEAEAHAAAAAELRRRSRGKRTLSLSLAIGHPDLIAGQPLRVSGFRPEIDTVDWLIDSLTHTLDERGLTTDLQAEEG